MTAFITFFRRIKKQAGSVCLLLMLKSLSGEDLTLSKYHKSRSNAREDLHMAISMHISIIIIALLILFCIVSLLSSNLYITIT